jgi:hypothetical protein
MLVASMTRSFSVLRVFALSVAHHNGLVGEVLGTAIPKRRNEDDWIDSIRESNKPTCYRKNRQ